MNIPLVEKGTCQIYRNAQDLLAVRIGTSTEYKIPLSGTATISSQDPIFDSITLAKDTVTQTTSDTTAVTIHSRSGIITTQALSTAAGAETSFQVVNSNFTPQTSHVFVSIQSYTGNGTPVVFVSKTDSTGFYITISNTHADTALDAAMKISFVIL